MTYPKTLALIKARLELSYLFIRDNKKQLLENAALNLLMQEKIKHAECFVRSWEMFKVCVENDYIKAIRHFAKHEMTTFYRYNEKFLSMGEAETTDIRELLKQISESLEEIGCPLKHN